MMTMRIITTLVLSMLSVTLMAQVPQGVGYQGVATDASGIELVNQAISIRASVLSGSANGTVEWEETHATTTDTFGLFTLTIGQGTNTTNGVQTSFADISWGTNTHFLKIEMDVTGGSTYSNMGTNQMMSVPYALYAESANINYDSISNLLSNDSTFITNVGGGMGGGCDLSYPDGFGAPLSFKFESSNNYTYTVPNGKRFYIQNIYNYATSINGYLTINSHNIYKLNNSSINPYPLNIPIIINEGDIISMQTSNPANNSPCILHGFLVNSNSDIIPITNTPTNAGSPYVVPNGKKLIITNFQTTTSQITIDANGSSIAIGYGDLISLGAPLILNSSQQLEGSSGSAFNGYLVDENYFAGCGGSSDGGNSNSSSGGGCSFQYPDGLEGEPVLWNFSNGNYTVPSGKNLYISAAYDWSYDVIEISTETVNYMGSIPNGSAFIFNDNHEIYDSNNAGNFNGYLVDEDYFADCGGGGSSSSTTSSNSVGDFSYPDGKDNMIPIIHDLSASTYTVPSGKNLYITSYTGINSSDELQISSNTVFRGRGQYSNGQGAPVGLFELPIIVASSEIVSAPGKMNGFLVDASIAPINFSLSYANNITYTVPAGKILVLLNFYSANNGGYGSLKADGMSHLYGIFNYYDNIAFCSPPCETTNIKNPLFFDENTIISSGDELQVINGYLMDK
jgi:hypothetical protein